MTEIQTEPYENRIEKIILAKERTPDEQVELDDWLEGCSGEQWEWYLDLAKQRHLSITRKRLPVYTKKSPASKDVVK